jgi:hypothetical protein
VNGIVHVELEERMKFGIGFFELLGYCSLSIDWAQSRAAVIGAGEGEGVPE